MMQVSEEFDLDALDGALARMVRENGFAAGRRFRLPGSAPPWHPTGIELAAGQHYSLFADGRISWSSRHPNLYGGPRFHLWARVAPGGRTVNLTANSGTFTADCNGTLELGIYMGMWADEFGALASSLEPYRELGGALDVIVLTYDGKPEDVLRECSGDPRSPGVLRQEFERLAHETPPPAGWEYLHECGSASIYHAEAAPDGQVINVEARNDQGILRRPVDFPLDPDTVLEWRWRVDEHPSAAREDRAVTHDYISVAAEFDSGRDLTWIWSSCMPLGAHFACPVKVWSERETHYVVRSGDDRLGRWYPESRRVYADVIEAMGPPPRRITAVWLIALSTFQHRTARASFAGIKLTRAGTSLTVL